MVEGVTEFSSIVPGFTGLHWDLPAWIEFQLGFHRFFCEAGFFLFAALTGFCLLLPVTRLPVVGGGAGPCQPPSSPPTPPSKR